MGINWTDLGNIAKGAIERDKETFYDGENSFAGISKKIK